MTRIPGFIGGVVGNCSDDGSGDKPALDAINQSQEQIAVALLKQSNGLPNISPDAIRQRFRPGLGALPQSAATVNHFEFNLWLYLTLTLFNLTVNDLRLPLEVSRWFGIKMALIPYWGHRDNYLPRGDEASLVTFAAHIFFAFIQDGVKLAIGWWQDYLLAFSSHLKVQNGAQQQ